MADEQARMSNYLAEDIVDNIDEVRTARGEYDSLDDRLDDIESGSFTPTQAQLAAINSGITDDDVAQITTNKNNILLSEKLNGRYNLAETNNATFTRDTYIRCALKANVSYYLRIGSFTSEATGVPSQILFYKGSQQVGAIEGGRFINHGDDVSVVFTPNSVIDSIRLYSGNDGSASDNKSATFTNLCIIEKSVYDAGFTDYQPYALPNTELTALEKQNENNISSLQNNYIKCVITNTSTTFTPEQNCHYIVLLQAGTASALYGVYYTSQINIARIAGDMTTDSCTESGGVVTIATTAWSMISIIKIGKSSN